MDKIGSVVEKECRWAMSCVEQGRVDNAMSVLKDLVVIVDALPYLVLTQEQEKEILDNLKRMRTRLTKESITIPQNHSLSFESVKLIEGQTRCAIQ